MKLVPIVEGHGEEAALPVLLRRLTSGRPVEIERPIRIPKGRLMQESELARAIRLAALHAGPRDAILVMLDADDDCAVTLATQVLSRAEAARPDRAIAVVVAVREFEAWFVAAASSLAATGKLRPDALPPEKPEAIGDPKGWLSERMTQPHRMNRRYSETIDQPSFAALFDLDAAQVCRSFKKLRREVERLTDRA